MKSALVAATLLLGGCLSTEGIEPGCPCESGFYCCEIRSQCLPLSDRSCLHRLDVPLLEDVTWGSLGGQRVFGSHVSAVDLDRDGQLDLAFASSNDAFGTDPAVFLGRGGLDFERADGTLVALDKGHAALVPGDFDDDGVTELMAIQLDSADWPALPLALGEDGRYRPSPQAAAYDGPTPGKPILTPVDFDGDGDLDLLGCHERSAWTELRSVDRLPLLVENLAGAPAQDQFVPRDDITISEDGSTDRCVAAAPADFDGDGDVDLATCGLEVRLFENRGGTLHEVTAERQLSGALPADRLPGPTHRSDLELACNAIRWMDANNDGRLDLFFSTLPHATWRSGAFVLTQGPNGLFAPMPPDVDLDRARRTCAPSPEFEEATLGLTYGDGVWLDVDHDTDLDYFTPLPSKYCAAGVQLYINEIAQGRMGFSSTTVPIRRLVSSAGLTTADLDSDGDLDIVANAWGEGHWSLLRNNHRERTLGTFPEPDHVFVRAIVGAHDAIGAIVHVDMDGPVGDPDFAPGRGKLQVRVIGGSSLSREPPIAHFGLGDVVGPLWVRVTLTDGTAIVERVDDRTGVVTLRAP